MVTKFYTYHAINIQTRMSTFQWIFHFINQSKILYKWTSNNKESKKIMTKENLKLRKYIYFIYPFKTLQKSIYIPKKNKLLIKKR